MCLFKYTKEYKKNEKRVDLVRVFLYTIGATAWMCKVAGTLKSVVMDSEKPR